MFLESSNLLKPSNLHEYQKECILHMLYNEDSMLWLQMGLGKTIIALTAIVDRMRVGQIKKTIIFGPVRVIETVWIKESKKWSHTNHLTFSIIRGTPQQRVRALFREADVYLINYELMKWFVDVLSKYYTSKKKEIPFQCVIYDEVTNLKKSTSLRMHGGKRDRLDKNGIRHEVKFTGWNTLINSFKYRCGLTGTPASNGYLDLHGQYLAVDGGKRLGVGITRFKQTYFSKSYNGFSYEISDMNKQWIERRISDITIKMDAKDYLDMPAVKTVNMFVELPDKVKEHYKQVEKDLFTKLESGTEIELFNKTSISNKCLQFCNGTPYTDTITKTYEKIHDVKLEALASILEEAAGSPVLCSYTFTSDAERMMQYFKKYKPVNLTASKGRETQTIINNWNKGKIKLLIGHPKSMGHGIDGLQESGSIVVWFGLNWSLELYEQLNGRINRQGQSKPVSIIRILCKNTVDMAVADAIARKDDSQEGLKLSLDRYKRGVIDDNFEVNFY